MEEQPAPLIDSMRDLILSDNVTESTREALLPRLQRAQVAAQLFDEHTLELLRRVCTRLIPQPGADPPLDIAGNIDARLAEGKSDGWRYDALPPDGEAFRQGLNGIDESASIAYKTDFMSLEMSRQDELLMLIQRGEAPGVIWSSIPSKLFFEDLLAEAVECYYSDPASFQSIGYVGMADAKGWHEIGLDQSEGPELRSLEKSNG